MKTASVAVCASLISIITMTFGCKGADDPAAAAASPTTGWLLGDWSGDFKDKSAGTDSALRDPTDATMTIVSTTTTGTDASQRGTFALNFPDLAASGAKVAGSINDFQGKSVMMIATSSDLPAIFPVGKQVSLDYTLITDQLSLSSSRIEIRLLRKGDAPTDPTKTDPNVSHVSPLVGQWQCTDQKGYQWSVEMKSEESFDVWVKNPPGPSLYFSGTMSLIKNDDARDADLSVTACADTRYIGMLMRAKLNGTSDMTLQRYGSVNGSAQQVVDTIPCTRS